MGRFAEVYTDEQRAAVRRAGAVDGWPPKRIMDAAQAGQLAGLEPFTIPKSTVADLVRREKRRLAGERDKIGDLDGNRAADDLRRRTLNLADVMLTRAEARARTHKLPPADFETVSRAVLRIAQQLEGKMPADGAAPKPTGNGNGNGHKGGLLERLAAETSSTAPNTQGNRDAKGTPPTTDTQAPIATHTDAGLSGPRGSAGGSELVGDSAG